MFCMENFPSRKNTTKSDRQGTSSPVVIWPTAGMSLQTHNASCAGCGEQAHDPCNLLLCTFLQSEYMPWARTPDMIKFPQHLYNNWKVELKMRLYLHGFPWSSRSWLFPDHDNFTDHRKGNSSFDNLVPWYEFEVVSESLIFCFHYFITDSIINLVIIITVINPFS